MAGVGGLAMALDVLTTIFTVDIGIFFPCSARPDQTKCDVCATQTVLDLVEAVTSHFTVAIPACCLARTSYQFYSGQHH